MRLKARGFNRAACGFWVLGALVCGGTGLVRAQTDAADPPPINLDDYDPAGRAAPRPVAPVVPGSGGSRAGTEPSASGHLLSPDDLILVEVYQEPDLTARRRIGSEGGITLNYFENQPIPVGGKTLEEAQALIQSLYEKDVLVNPRVTITLLEAAKWKFIVMGEVMRPDTYEVNGGTRVTVVHALAMAGGATSLGNLKNVLVTRFQNDAKQVLKLDIHRMMRDVNAQPFVVRPGDIITVGEKVF